VDLPGVCSHSTARPEKEEAVDPITIELTIPALTAALLLVLLLARYWPQ